VLFVGVAGIAETRFY